MNRRVFVSFHANEKERDEVSEMPNTFVSAPITTLGDLETLPNQDDQRTFRAYWDGHGNRLESFNHAKEHLRAGSMIRDMREARKGVDDW